MSIYQRVYYTLCNNRKQLKEQYGYGSGLHEHHILPRHSGGTDEEENLTYLTVREHIIAHFLLWKIHKNPLDLGAMKMLGANITTHQRIELGKWCHANKVGIHSDSYKNNKEANSYRCKLSTKTQRELGVGIHNPETFTKYASMGGMSGGKNQRQNKIGIHNPDNFKKNASLGGKSLKDMICVTNGKHRTRVRPDRLEEFLSNGYWRGWK